MILQSFMKIASAVLEILADKVGVTHTGTKSNHLTTIAYFHVGLEIDEKKIGETYGKISRWQP